MRRPEWWPRSLWPGRGSPRAERPEGDPTAPALSYRDRRPPAETFLRAFATASGADRAVIFRLEADRATWTVDASVGEEGSTLDAGIRASGHPLTWCLKEKLLVQLRAEELVPRAEGGGWALAGPVPGTARMLVATWAASPPIRSREALGAALAHLGALADAGLLERSARDREPLSGSAGRQ